MLHMDIPRSTKRKVEGGLVGSQLRTNSMVVALDLNPCR